MQPINNIESNQEMTIIKEDKVNEEVIIIKEETNTTIPYKNSVMVETKPKKHNLLSKIILVVEYIALILKRIEKFNELLQKANIHLKDEEYKQTKNILAYLNTELDDTRPINKIIEAVLNALSDDKLELYEIPTIINVIHESLHNFDSIKISVSDVGVLIKLILFILIETDTIKLSIKDFQVMSNFIDSCLFLLNKSVKIKIKTPKLKCFCF